MKRIEIIAIFFLIAVVGNRMIAQDVPTPAAVQTEAITLQGGRLHVGNGVVIEKSTIIFENGKISSVGNYSTNTKGKVIDVSGKDIYPGLIATSSELGLVEIEAVRATRDVNEVGLMNPNVRTAIAYNTDSRTTPTVRFNGVLSTQVTPNSGRISGTSSVMQMDAWNWEDALLKDDGVWIDFPNLFSYSGWWAEPGGMEARRSACGCHSPVEQRREDGAPQEPGGLAQAEQERRWQQDQRPEHVVRDVACLQREF